MTTTLATTDSLMHLHQIAMERLKDGHQMEVMLLRERVAELEEFMIRARHEIRQRDRTVSYLWMALAALTVVTGELLL